jgi:hypothetical protein
MAGRHGSAPGERRGGRKRGTPNKITQNVIAELEALGYHPIAELIEIIRDAKEEFARSQEIHDKIQENRDDAEIKGYVQDTGPQYLSIAAKAAGDLMKFVYPTRKAVDVTSGGQSMAQSFSEIVKTVLQNKDEPGKAT